MWGSPLGWMPLKMRMLVQKYPEFHGSEANDLVALLLARVPGRAAAGVAEPRAGRGRACAARGDASARLRGRGAGAARGACWGGRGAGVRAAGGRLRRVVPRVLGDQHPREAEDHAADG